MERTGSTPQPTVIVCLHGFLGQPSDWNAFVKTWQRPGVDFFVPSLWQDSELGPDLSLQDWGCRLCQRLLRDWPNADQFILCGYSLGGRLAMQAFASRPSLFAGALFLSAGVGGETEEVNQARKLNDEKWSQRFLLEEWDQVLHDWNAQPVLQNSPITSDQRALEAFRPQLAQALTKWSPAHQAAFVVEASMRSKVFFVSGDQDPVYCAKYEKLTREQPGLRHVILPGYGHRLLLDELFI